MEREESASSKLPIERKRHNRRQARRIVMTRYRIFLLLLLLCATGIPFIVVNAWQITSPPATVPEGFRRGDPQDYKDELIKDLGGAAGVNIILYADRVEAFRINPPDDSRS